MADALDFSGLKPAETAAPASEGGLDFSGLKPLDFSGLKPITAEVPPTPLKTFARQAAGQALPMAAGFAGAVPGAEAGAALGAMTGPFAPIAAPVGGLIGGLATGLPAAWLASQAQETAIGALPERAQEAIGQSEAQRRADIQTNPKAAFIGQIAPQLLTLRPSAELAVGRRLFGAGLQGGQEAIAEARNKEDLDPEKIGLAALAGASMDKETRLGTGLREGTEAGLARITGRAAPPAPGAATAPPSANPARPADVETVSTAPAAAPQGVPQTGDVIGLKFPKQPSRRATVGEFWDDGNSVRVHYDDGSTADLNTSDMTRDLVPPPPERAASGEVRDAATMGKGISTAEAFDLHREAEEAMRDAELVQKPPPLPPMGQDAIGAVGRAQALRAQVNDPNSRLTIEQRQSLTAEADRLESQYGANAAPGAAGISQQDIEAAQARAALEGNQATGANILGQDVPGHVPTPISAEDMAAANARRRLQNAPPQYTDAEIETARNNPGTTPNLMGQEVPNLPGTPRQFTPEELEAAEQARQAAAQPEPSPQGELAAPQAPKPVAPKPIAAPIATEPAAIEPAATGPKRDLRRTPTVPVPPIRALDLVQWIRRNGGIKDSDGTLDEMFNGKAPPGLIANRNGMQADDAARRARDAGYFPDQADNPNGVDPMEAKHLFQAIEEHFAPVPERRYPESARLEVEARNNALAQNDELKNLKAEHGIADWRGMTTDEFYQAIADRQARAAAKRAEIEANPRDTRDEAAADSMEDEHARAMADLEARTGPDLPSIHDALPWEDEHHDAWEPDPDAAAQAAAKPEAPGGFEEAGPKRGLPGDLSEDLFGNGENAGARRGAPAAPSPAVENQLVIPGAERSAAQAAASRETEGRGRLQARVPQKEADQGLFAPPDLQTDLFAQPPPKPAPAAPAPAEWRNAPKGSPAPTPIPDTRPPAGYQGEFHRFVAAGGYDPQSAVDLNRAARDYVLARGNDHGTEFMVAYDGAQNQVAGVTSNHQTTWVNLNDVAAEAIRNSADVVIHHNHPSNSPMSRNDVSMLQHPGLSWVFAHANDGSLFSAARLSDRMQASLAGRPSVRENLLRNSWDLAFSRIAEFLRFAYNRGEVSLEDANKLGNEVVNRTLAAAGLIDYVSNHPLVGPREDFIESAMRAGIDGVLGRLRALKIEGNPRDVAFAYRPATDVRAVDAVDAIFGDAAGAGARPEAGPGNPVGDETGGGAHQAASPDGETRGAGRSPEQLKLLESDDEKHLVPPGIGHNQGPQLEPTSPEPQQDAAHQIAQNAAEHAAQTGGGGGEGNVAKAAADDLPAPRDRKTRLLGAVAKFATMPRTLASMDWRSARYWQARQDKSDRTYALQHRWSDMSQDYVALSPKQRAQLSAKEELDRLNSTVSEDDGRRIVFRNDNQPKAEFTQPGEGGTLDPQTTAVYHQRRALFSDVWQTVIDASAKKLGWTGSTDPADLKAAYDAAQSKGAKTNIGQVMDIVQGLADQKRAGYVPLMRFGDYYIKITPKPGVDPQSQGGFPEIARFELVDSRSDQGIGSRLLGRTVSEGAVPKAAADRMAELRQHYPEDQYEIEHNYLAADRAATLRNLDIPAVEKLLIALQQKDSDLFGPMVDELRTKMYEEMTAGFKKKARNVPGYSTDFGRVTGAYLNWTAGHAAELEHGDAIRSAEENYIDRHPDAAVQRYWKKWADYQNSPAEEFQTLRQFGFYWQLAANPSSTLLIATHGPMVMHATLGAGTGYLGAGRALYGAFGEALRNLKLDAKRGAYIDMENMGRTPEEKALIQEAIGTGQVHASAAEDLRALGQGQEQMMGLAGGQRQRVLDILSSNIKIADQMNRVGALLGTYRFAQKPGVLDAMAKTWGDNQLFRAAVERDGLTPATVAKFMVDEGLFVWGKRNRAPIQRGAGALMFQFKNFEANYLSTLHKFMTRMGPDGKIAGTLMMGSLAALGGALALPFATDLTDAYDWVHKTITGIDPMTESKMRALMESAGAGKQGAEAVLHGGARWALGTDLSSRLGFGDVVSRNMNGIDALGTVPSMMYGRLTTAWNRYTHGQTTAAVADLLPTAVRNLVRATGVLPQEGVETQYGNPVLAPGKLSTGDLVRAGMGFEPTPVARAYEEKEYETRSAKAFQDYKSRMLRQVVDLDARAIAASQKGDTGQVANAQRQIQQIYRDNPDVRLSHQAIKAGILAKTNPDLAALKKMPKELRGQESPYPAP